MKTIWTEGTRHWQLRASNLDRVVRYVEIRRYKIDVVVELVTYDPAVTRNAWTGYEWDDLVVPSHQLIAVDAICSNQELIRAAIKWYETGEWKIESDEESE